MNWLMIAFLAPFLWAISNFIDKFLVSKYFKGRIGTLIIYSCSVGLPISLLILIFKPEVLQVNLSIALFMVLNGFFYIAYLFPYLKALHKADTSIVTPIFQTIPVFSYFLAFFVLGETLTKMQMVASAFIILGAVGISLKFENGKTRFRKEVVFLMLLASIIISLNSLLFKFFAIQLDFWTVSFWQYVGFLLFGSLIFMFSRSYRRDFLSSFTRDGKKIIGLNIANESINIIAVMIFTYATLLAPLSLVQVINGFQPLFTFMLGAVLTLFVPHLIKENLEGRILVQKILFMVLMIIGAYLLGI